MLSFLFLVKIFFLSTSLSICIILSGIRILDFMKIPCWLNSPGKSSSCEYGHKKLICFICSFKNPSQTCLWKLISLNLKEDNIFTSSLGCLIVSILHILVDRGKGGQAMFFSLINEATTPLINAWYVISWNNNLSGMKCGSQCWALVLPIIHM